MRVVVCWAGMQGYVASCLHALGRLEGVELHVLYLDFQDLPFQEELLDGVSNTRILATDPDRRALHRVVDLKPDVVFVCGWFYGPYRELLDHPGLRSAKLILGIDTPWTGAWQQQLNRIWRRGFLRKMDRVVVAGSRSRQMAVRLGTSPDRIRSGFYGFDFSAFEVHGQRMLDGAAAWPNRFLFAGRYAPEKGLGVLLDAYRRYRSSVERPWPLHVCGAGAEAWRFRDEAGVTDLGYVQPSCLPTVFADHGVFVMPSLEEPWGVAIAEAAATGLPLICSEACGAAEELLRPRENGLLVPTGDASTLAAAMIWMHQHPERMRPMSAVSRRLAQAHSAQAWAERMRRYFIEALDGHVA